MTKIKLNGEPYELDQDMVVAGLLERLGLRATRVAVEINQRVIPRAEYQVVGLKEGDSVEVINFVGGG